MRFLTKIRYVCMLIQAQKMDHLSQLKPDLDSDKWLQKNPDPAKISRPMGWVWIPGYASDSGSLILVDKLLRKMV